MAGKVHCDNLVQFEASTGRYLRCDFEIDVPEDRLGGLVECPECGHLVAVPASLAVQGESSILNRTGSAQPSADGGTRQVPGGVRSPSSAPGASSRSAAPGASSPGASAAKRNVPSATPPGARPTSSDQGERGRSRGASGGDAARVSPRGAGRVSPAAVGPVTSESGGLVGTGEELRLAPEVTRGELLSSLPPTEKRLNGLVMEGRPCENCGERLRVGDAKCSRCGAPRKALWQDDELPSGAELNPTGFQRWGLRLLADGIKPVYLRIFGGGIVGMISLLAVGLGALGGPATLVIGLVIAALLGGGFAKICMDSMRIARQPLAKLSLWQRWGWGGVRVFLQTLDWQPLGSRLPREARLSLAGREVTDADLLQEPLVNQVRWLDLSNTKITDEGLRYLRGLQRLEYLLLLGTNVSDEAVFRLQQTIPRCWIWR